jgi:glycolate oxidase iron-sulfur subunit
MSSADHHHHHHTQTGTPEAILTPAEITHAWQAPACQGATSTKQLLDACIHCGICLTSCPTYTLTGNEAESPRGRLYLMRQWEVGRLTDPEDLAPHLDHCLGCLNCQTACPSQVQYGTLLNDFRAKLLPQRQQGFSHALKRFGFRYILPHRWVLNLMGLGLWLYQQSGLQAWVRRHRLLRWLPALEQREALSPAVARQMPPALKEGQVFGDPDTQPIVGLHLGCMMDTVFRPVHWATVRVLQENGYCVVIPKQGCCGALAHHAGEADLALAVGAKNLKGLASDPRVEWIVMNSAGCGAHLKESDHLMPADSPLKEVAGVVARKTIDITELLVKKPLAPMRQCPTSKTVTYHPACHLHHAQKVVDPPLDLLKQIPDLHLQPLPEAEACCGSAGIYNLENPDWANGILERKLQNLQQTGASVVVTGNPGCHLQLTYGLREGSDRFGLERLPQSVLHPVELLAMAYGWNRESHFQLQQKSVSAREWS